MIVMNSSLAAPQTTVTIDPRFAGFPDRAIGGYAGGLLAGTRPLEARFRAPVPLGAPLEIEAGEGVRRLRRGDAVLVEGRPWRAAVPLPAPPSMREAARATDAYSGHRRHLFPGCFCCGPSRRRGDGLRVFPGPVPGRELVAARWLPAAPVGPPEAWAALDCPAIWALIWSAERGSPDRIVTGTMATELRGEVTAGEPYVVYAWRTGSEGRRRMTGAAIADQRGDIVAVSTQTFVTVPAGVPIDPALWFDA